MDTNTNKPSRLPAIKPIVARVVYDRYDLEPAVMEYTSVERAQEVLAMVQADTNREIYPAAIPGTARII